VADHAADGEEGLALALDGGYDVLIVDRMLPKLDGLSVIGRLRAKNVATPALILSALGAVDDRVRGLRAGGDDYLPKPYSFSELLARIEVLARRHAGRGEDTLYRVGDLELDRLSHRPARTRSAAAEFRLLEYLMKHAGRWSPARALRTSGTIISIRRPTSSRIFRGCALRSTRDSRSRCTRTVRGPGYMIRVTALGKLLHTTAFQLTLVYLVVFALFSAFLLGYFALNTRDSSTTDRRHCETEIAAIAVNTTVGIRHRWYRRCALPWPGSTSISLTPRPAKDWPEMSAPEPGSWKRGLGRPYRRLRSRNG
jgi:two-component system OmpR family response regulator